MSFKNAAALQLKSDKFFGLDKDDLSLKPQMAGWLSKKPEKGAMGSLANLAGWSKKWFIVKDSFLFWYDSETKDEQGFDTKPRGCLPLGGAAVSLLKDKTTFELAHPAFDSGEVLTLRANDAFEASEWVTQIKSAMNATWENAILGYALIEKMKAKGTALEAEKEAAVQEAQLNAERLQREKDESARLSLMKLETTEALALEKLKMESEVEELKKKASGLGNAEQLEKAAYEEEKRKRQAIEQALVAASHALMDLEAAFSVRSVDAKGTVFKDDAQVKSGVAALREFFDARAHEFQRKRNFFEKKKG